MLRGMRAGQPRQAQTHADDHRRRRDQVKARRIGAIGRENQGWTARVALFYLCARPAQQVAHIDHHQVSLVPLQKPFAEFVWADYLRPDTARKQMEKSMETAVREAMGLAKGPLAFPARLVRRDFRHQARQALTLRCGMARSCSAPASKVFTGDSRPTMAGGHPRSRPTH